MRNAAAAPCDCSVWHDVCVPDACCAAGHTRQRRHSSAGGRHACWSLHLSAYGSAWFSLPPASTGLNSLPGHAHDGPGATLERRHPAPDSPPALDGHAGPHSSSSGGCSRRAGQLAGARQKVPGRGRRPGRAGEGTLPVVRARCHDRAELGTPCWQLASTSVPAGGRGT